MNAAIIIAPKACTGTSIPVNIAVIFKLFINRVSLNASTKLSAPIKVAWFNVVGTSKNSSQMP